MNRLALSLAILATATARAQAVAPLPEPVAEPSFPTPMALSSDDRRCAVAKLFDRCWKRQREGATLPLRIERMDGALMQIRNFVVHACRNTRDGKASVSDVIDAVWRAWGLGMGARR